MTSKSQLAELSARVRALEWVLYQLAFVLAADEAIPPGSLVEWLYLSIEAAERHRTLLGREHAAVVRYANWLAGIPETERERLEALWRRLSKPNPRRRGDKARPRSGKK